MSDKTLVALMDEIVEAGSRFQETGDRSYLLIMDDRASVLADRLNCQITSAICYAFIMIEATWGRMPTRSDIMKFLPPGTSITDRLRSIWELCELNLIQIYQPTRSPVRHFYIDQETAELLVANRVPPNKNSEGLFNVSDRMIRVRAFPNNPDYEILLNENAVGYVLKSSSGSSYDVYWLGKHVFSGDSIDDITDWLNHEFEKGRLKATQD